MNKLMNTVNTLKAVDALSKRFQLFLPFYNIVFSFFKDSLNDEEVGYGIAGGNLGSVFDVDANSGRVFVNQSLDFETTSHFELWIKTFYKTKPLFFAAKKIVIEVKDKNDNAPVFENQLVKVRYFSHLILYYFSIKILIFSFPRVTVGFEPSNRQTRFHGHSPIFLVLQFLLYL